MIQSPLVSVVMPVYNVQDYLREAIESVISQTIGFERSIELILINDGSTDRSGEICEEYQALYPNNILYIKQNNQGLSASRYNGFIKASGVYIHSLDSDDWISANFYKDAVDFLQKNKKQVDFISSKMIFVESKTGNHYLNYKFKKSRIIDVNREPTSYQYHLASCVVRRDAIKKEWFDTKISIAEDARLVSIVLNQKRAYGVVSTISYFYRVRSSGNSLMNTQYQKRDFYTETPKRFWEFCLDLWTDEHGDIHRYIQGLILNDIQWRLNEQKTQNILSVKEESVYKEFIYDIVSQLDDDIILNQPRLAMNMKLFLLNKKYRGNLIEYLRTTKDAIFFNDHKMVNTHDGSQISLVVDFITHQGGNNFKFEGYPSADLIHPRSQYVIRTSRGDFILTPHERKQRQNTGFLGDTINNFQSYSVDIETSGENDQIKAYLIHWDGTEVQIPINCKRHTRVGSIHKSYRRYGNIFLRNNMGILEKYKYTRQLSTLFELRYLASILTNIRLKDTYRFVVMAKDDAVNPSRSIKQKIISTLKPFAFFIRTVYLNMETIVLRTIFHALPQPRVPIWIVSDRGMAAGDNGEAFFRYMMSRRNNLVKVYFAINKTSEDYSRMKRIGPVLDMQSYRYKIMFMRASKIISSQADEYITNPFGAREMQIVNLLNFDFIFLQHGVTKNDISGWLNKYFKNIKLFITVADREYKSIVDGRYGYSSDEVLLSGFPRYDYLDSNPSNKLIITPTWRKYLTNQSGVGKGGVWPYQDNFKDSEYFKFYNKLMNDKRIIDALRGAKMTGEFYLHPSHATQIEDFKGNDYFKVMKFPYDYKKALREGSLLVTDYSSVYFDFSYLHKPMIYSQFDKEYFTKNHGVYEEGYFNEERDGFGPVCYDYESTIDTIVTYIHNNCTLEGVYRRRIESFFKYQDKDNSKRVYEAIVQRLK